MRSNQILSEELLERCAGANRRLRPGESVLVRIPDELLETRYLLAAVPAS